MIDESELAELESAILSGVTIGIGSQVLVFGEVASIIVQCEFIVRDSQSVNSGHGELVETSALLFDFLNERVLRAQLENDGRLVLMFEGSKALTLVPEENGFESYVLSTRLGISPVIY